MSIKRIAPLAFICLILIFVSQVYLVFDYFNTTKASLTRETDAILSEAFKSDLKIRHELYQHSIGEDTLVVPPPPPKSKITSVVYDERKVDKNAHTNIIDLTELAINSIVSKSAPLKLRQLDSVAANVLKSRGIYSDYRICILDPNSGKIREQSKPNANSGLFEISSKPLTIDFFKTTALQMVLVNPFVAIITRMWMMLASSLILSIICMFAFRFLLQVLAKQKQLVAFKNDFLGNIAHELKRPVASLTFNLDCLNTPGVRDNKTQCDQLIAKSINATAELNDTINMIVALTQVEEGLLVLNKQAVNLKELFEELRERFLQVAAKKVEISTHFDTDEIISMGDYNLLMQCFANLLDNAIKYSDNDVEIAIAVSNCNAGVQVAIKDNGIGISEDKLPYIFDKYSRISPENNKIKGFGIGLNYVKTIIEKHKGQVSVTSKPGIGTEFCVLLPC